MSGLTISLFEALDCADVVEIDGCEVEDLYQQLTPARRVIRLANDDVIDFVDQVINIAGGQASFRDVAGQQHRASFAVQRPLQESDVDILLF